MNWLLSAALEKNLQLLQMKINNTNPDVLQRLLDETVDVEEYTLNNAIHLLAKFFDGEGFYDLIDKLPATALNHFILKKNGLGMNGLTCALVFQRREEATLLLLSKLDKNVVFNALADQDNFGFTGFMAALEYQTPTIIEKVFAQEMKHVFLESLFLKDESKKNHLIKVMQKAPSSTALQVIDWMDDATLEKAVSEEEIDSWNALHYAALFQDPEVLLTLNARLSSKVLNHLATRVNIRKENFLHYILSSTNQDTAMAYLNKLTTSTLQEAIQEINGKHQTPYAMAITNQEADVVKYLTDVLSDEQLSQTVGIRTKEVPSPLLLLAQYQEEELFSAILKRIDKSTLRKILVDKDENNNTLFQTCAARFSSQTILLLVEAADQTIIDKNLKIQARSDYYNGWNVLNFLACFHQGLAIKELTAKATTEAIDFAISTTCLNENAYGYNALHHAFSLEDDEAIISLLDKISPEALNKALRAINKYGWTPLHTASFASNSALSELLQLANTETLEFSMLTATTSPESRGTNLLHHLLLFQPYEVIKTICEKVGQEVLEKAFLMQLQYPNRQGFDALMLMTFHCNNEIVRYFIEKISPEIIEKSLSQRLSSGCNALHYAARSLRAETFMALCDKLSDELFSEKMAEVGDMFEISQVTPLQIVLNYQFTEVSSQILRRMNPQNLEKAISSISLLGFSPLTSILKLNDGATIQYVLNQLSDSTLKKVLNSSHQHFYQMLIENSSLDPNEAELILQELTKRVG